MISDKRRIRVTQVIVSKNEMTPESGAEFWQDTDGNVVCVGLWSDLLVPFPEDLKAQATAKGISTVEWLRQRLDRIPYLQVEVVTNA